MQARVLAAAVTIWMMQVKPAAPGLNHQVLIAQ
jgi:hypothetical protein